MSYAIKRLAVGFNKQKVGYLSKTKKRWVSKYSSLFLFYDRNDAENYRAAIEQNEQKKTVEDYFYYVENLG